MKRGSTPMTRPPAASAASARCPIEPTLPPPYTSVTLLRANSRPSRAAASWYAASHCRLDAQ